MNLGALFRRRKPEPPDFLAAAERASAERRAEIDRRRSAILREERASLCDWSNIAVGYGAAVHEMRQEGLLVQIGSTWSNEGRCFEHYYHLTDAGRKARAGLMARPAKEPA